jgi:DNA-binding NarL/FixJ family response regulator
VLLDYKMPHVQDFESLVREIVRVCPTARVIVLSGFASPDIARRAASGGARGYVLKSTRLSAMFDAIRTVGSGGIWIDPALPRKEFDIFPRESTSDGGQREGMAALTRREREVLGCVAQGISNRDIATKLCVSEQTVKTHLTRIFAKLSVDNRVAAALAFYGRDQVADTRPEIRT